MASLPAAPDEVAQASETSNAANLPAWRRWLILFILLTGGIKTTLAFTTVVPALQLIAAHFHNSTDSVLSAQFVVTLAPVGMAVAGLLSGWVVSLGGLRRTLYISLTACAIAGLAQLVIDNFQVLLASRFLLGLAAVTSDVAMTSILAAEFSGKTRGMVIGFRQAISSAGTVLTMLAGGWLAQHYGWRAPSWMFLFPVGLLALALIAFDRPIVLAKRHTERERFSVWQLWPIFALQLVMSIAHTMPSFQIPFLLRENGITNAIQVSEVPALSSLVSVLSAAAFGLVYSWIGRWTLVFAALFMGGGFIGVGYAPNFNFILMCVVFEGIGAGWTIPYFQNRMLDRVTPAQRGQAIGFVTTAYFLGQFINPILTAPIRNAFGIHFVFVAVGGALIIGGMLLATWALITRKREEIV